MENRRFERIKFTAKGQLSHLGVSYLIRLENISLGGALISSDECLMVVPGETCELSIRLEVEDAVLTVTVEVVHSFFSMVGVKFTRLEKDAEQQLTALLKRLSEGTVNKCN